MGDLPLFIATKTPWGAVVKFPKDPALIAAFRAKFPKARFLAATKSWSIPGKLAEKRALLWIESWRTHPLADPHIESKCRDDLAFAPLKKSQYVTIGKSWIVIRTPYNKSVVAAIKTIPGAHWDEDQHYWIIPFYGLAGLRVVLPVIEQTLANHRQYR